MDDNANKEDSRTFLRSLHTHLVEDFMRGEFKPYFYNVRGIVEVDRVSRIAVKSKKAMLYEGSIRQRTAIAPLAQKHGGGLLLVLVFEDSPEPWVQYSEPAGVPQREPRT